MAVPQIAYPTYTLMSSTELGTAQVLLCVARDEELIGSEGSDSLARLLVTALGQLTGSTVSIVKSTMTQTDFI
jgi:hypothetical protein